MDYLEEPDIFHDLFGHVPLLANPSYSDFIQAYGKGGQRAMQLGMLTKLARLYWYRPPPADLGRPPRRNFARAALSFSCVDGL
jgi:hypothetical protein